MIGKKTSLYKILSLMIVSIVIITMFTYSTYHYINTKNSMLKDLKTQTDISILQLKKVIAPFIESYSINEYEKILVSYLGHKDIVAIIVENYKMSEIMGGNSVFITGKMRGKNWNIIDFEVNAKNEKVLESAFYSRSEYIINENGIKIGKIYIYSSDHFIKIELQNIIIISILTTVIVSLILILFLYLLTRKYVLKPLSNIISIINDKDKNGIPFKILDEDSSLEVTKLSNSINSMMDAIKYSRNNLKNLNDQLQLTSNKYQSILKSASDGILIMKEDGSLLEFNDMASKLLGYSKDEMKNLSIFNWDLSLTREKFDELIKELSYEPVVIEKIHTRKDGSTYIAEITTAKINIDNKEYIFKSVRDITQRKENERLIEEQKEEFETIFNYSQDGIVIMDLKTNFLKFNDAYLKMTNYTSVELLKKSCLELTILEDRKKSVEAMEQVIAKGYIKNFEKTCILKEGKRIHVNVSMSLLPDKKRVLMVAKDTSSLKIMQEQARLASMGEMIGNIAHQWRQPLSVISASASALKLQSALDLATKEEVNECIDSVLKQTNYLSNTIDNFRDFIKGDNLFQEISIKETLKNTLSLVKASLDNNYITTTIDMKDDIEISGNKNELTEALINIINNSKDVLKNKEDEHDRLLFVKTRKIDEDELEVRILDSGGGIEEPLLDRIFEPYFTTKHKSQGTGLGLSIAYKILKETHNASIMVYNEEFLYNNKKYVGACFVITFKKII